MVSGGSKRVTLMDVAERSGVSYQTVSRVINNHPKVAEATRARVLKAINDLGYHPSFAAQSLAAGRTKTLAMITLGVGNYGPASMLYRMESIAQAAGYEMISAYVDADNEASVYAAVDRLRRWMVDGIMLIAPVECENRARFLDKIQDIPIVHIDSKPQTGVHSVVIDQHSGAITATQHLLALGHHKFAEIAGPLNWFGARSRHQATIDTLAQRGLSLVASEVGNWSPESGYACTKKLLADGKSFSAILVGNDHMALGTLAALHERGVRVPHDVSIVGFDNVAESPYYIPALTTVEQPFDDLGITAVNYLLAVIKDPELPPQQSQIPTRLVTRASVSNPDHYT